MKKKVFISFTEDDRNKMKLLRTAIQNSKSLIPIVVEDKKEGAIYLPNLVSKGILESDYFVPIFSKNSISSQWVNQETGFAFAQKNKIEILPLIDQSLIGGLKGFINNQVQLRYSFQSSERINKEQASFRKCYVELVRFLDERHSVIELDDAKNSEFIKEIQKGSLVISDNKAWLVLEKIRHSLFDKKTVERIRQLLELNQTTSMAASELIKLKEGQAILSKRGPVVNALQTWKNKKQDDNRLW